VLLPTLARQQRKSSPSAMQTVVHPAVRRPVSRIGASKRRRPAQLRNPCEGTRSLRALTGRPNPLTSRTALGNHRKCAPTRAYVSREHPLATGADASLRHCSPRAFWRKPLANPVPRTACAAAAHRARVRPALRRLASGRTLAQAAQLAPARLARDLDRRARRAGPGCAGARQTGRPHGHRGLHASGFPPRPTEDSTRPARADRSCPVPGLHTPVNMASAAPRGRPPWITTASWRPVVDTDTLARRDPRLPPASAEGASNQAGAMRTRTPAATSRADRPRGAVSAPTTNNRRETTRSTGVRHTQQPGPKVAPSQVVALAKKPAHRVRRPAAL